MTDDMTEEGPTPSFPWRLRKARSAMGLSNGDLARLSTVSAASISSFESGLNKPSFDNLRKLSDALDVSTDYLLGCADNVSPQPLRETSEETIQDESRMKFAQTWPDKVGVEVSFVGMYDGVECVRITFDSTQSVTMPINAWERVSDFVTHSLKLNEQYQQERT